MGSAATGRFFVDNRGEFSAGAGEYRRKRIRERLVLTVAVGLFLSALAGCGGGFFIHPTLSTTYISPAGPTIASDNTVQLAVFGNYSDGSHSEVNGDSVTWSSSNPAIATVTSPGGLVTGASVGTATITATTTATIPGTGCVVTVNINNGTPNLAKVCTSASTETLAATVNVNVTASNVNNAVINTTQGSTIVQSTATISGTQPSLQFYAYGNGDASNDLTEAVTWTSSNPGVATISSGLSSGNGLATTVAAGTTNITATSNSAGQVVHSQTIVLTVQ